MERPRSACRHPIVQEAEMSSEVLFVEDSAGDARLIQEAFRNFDGSIHVQLVLDGLETMAYLKSEGRYVKAPRPDLVLLDLELPNLHGREVLALVKSDATLKSIPVVVLTSSEVDADVWLSYKLQANGYIRKPPHWDQLDKIVRHIGSFYLGNTRLPQLVQEKLPTA
jgi:chemotaxis family two-component system response regulator Rcp1